MFDHRVIVPATMTGSPRYLQQRFQDVMASIILLDNTITKDIPQVQAYHINEDQMMTIKPTVKKSAELLIACQLKLAHVPFQALHRNRNSPKSVGHCMPPKRQAYVYGKEQNYHGG